MFVNLQKLRMKYNKPLKPTILRFMLFAEQGKEYATLHCGLAPPFYMPK